MVRRVQLRGPLLVTVVPMLVALCVLLTGCGASSASFSKPGVINAVGAENEYADVLAQIGGAYVHVS